MNQPPQLHPSRASPNARARARRDRIGTPRQRLVHFASEHWGIALRERCVLTLTLGMHWVRCLSGTSTRIKNTVQFGDIGFDAPGFGDRHTHVVFETDGTPPAVGLLKTVTSKKRGHGGPLPVRACVGPLNGNAPPEPQGYLCSPFEILPQGTCISTFGSQILLELLHMARRVHVIATRTTCAWYGTP